MAHPRHNPLALVDPKLSVVIPVYNEKATIDEILRRVIEPQFRKEIVLVDVVVGSPFLGGPQRVHYFWHYVANKLPTLLSDIFTNLKLTDMETCYKVFRREVLQGIQLKSNRFGFEPEITAKVAKGNWRVYEVLITYASGP